VISSSPETGELFIDEQITSPALLFEEPEESLYKILGL